MKITRRQLEKFIREEMYARKKFLEKYSSLSRILEQGGPSDPRAGDVHVQPTPPPMKPNLETAAGYTPEDIAQELIQSGAELTEQSVEQAVLQAGVLDDDVPDFVESILKLYKSAPEEFDKTR